MFGAEGQADMVLALGESLLTWPTQWDGHCDGEVLGADREVIRPPPSLSWGRMHSVEKAKLKDDRS